MITYQAYLYKAILTDFERGWEIDDLLFRSSEYENPKKAVLELDFYEPLINNWFTTLVEREDGRITDEEILDSSVIDIDERKMSRISLGI